MNPDILKNLSKMNNELDGDLSNLKENLEKLHLALVKLNLEYQWMLEEKNKQ
ncbi:MAG: hypothetical protein LW817_07010 [Candidatus Caenarcaniphilales bacterium]|nr:hypothetical protein [Candidatus Caenarcaniphilales bacterium]